MRQMSGLWARVSYRGYSNGWVLTANKRGAMLSAAEDEGSAEAAWSQQVPSRIRVCSMGCKRRSHEQNAQTFLPPPLPIRFSGWSFWQQHSGGLPCLKLVDCTELIRHGTVDSFVGHEHVLTSSAGHRGRLRCVSRIPRSNVLDRSAVTLI